MANGDGVIKERLNPKTGKSYSPKKWEVSVPFGFDPVSKKYKRVKRVVSGSKADAVQVRDQLREDRNNGLQVTCSSITFAEYAEEWLKERTVAGDVSPRSLDDDAYHIKRFNEFIGNVKLADINTRMVNSLYTKLKTSPRRSNKPLSGTTMHKHHVKLNQILESAVNDDLMRKNPCKKARVPKIDTPEASFLNAKEIARLRACVDAAEDEAYQRLHEKEERMAKLPKTAGRETVSGMNSISCLIAVRLGMATGARVGEVMGFEWQDVSSDYVKISVRRTIERNGAIKDKPKTKSGRRTISIDSKTADSLKRWRKQQHELLRSLGLDQNGRTPICCSNAATHFSNSNFERWWRIWRTEQGFPDLNFHKLRHTQATQLLGNNIPLTTVSARLGHKTPSITLNFYSHAIPEQDEEAAQLIGEILQGNPEPAHIIPMKTA